MALFGRPSIDKLKAEHDVVGLIDALKGKDWKRRRDAATALGNLKEPTALEPLIAALGDGRVTSVTLRREVAVALGELGDSRAVGPLITALDDEGQYVRDGATTALGRIGGPQAEQALAERGAAKRSEPSEAARGLTAHRPRPAGSSSAAAKNSIAM
jgi:HEAT repeat protein